MSGRILPERGPNRRPNQTPTQKAHLERLVAHYARLTGVAHEIVGVRYFTAKVQPRPGNPQQAQRQQAYLTPREVRSSTALSMSSTSKLRIV
jgi:hypothetical protein